MNLPSEVILYVQGVFEEIDSRVTSLLSNQPNIHEPTLDMHVIASLGELGASTMLDDGGGWIVTLQADVFGGLPLYKQWEVADIAIIVMVKHRGQVRKVKVGLLQSKRLYARGQTSRSYPLTAVDRVLHGLEEPERADLWGKRRSFSFDKDSKYETLKDDEQFEAILKFRARSKIPVFYLLYNPWTVPHKTKLPQTALMKFKGRPPVGARVIPAADVISIVRAKRDSPTYAEMTDLFRLMPADAKFGFAETAPGWRLENWVADLLLGCRLGHETTSLSDSDIRGNFFGRSYPISAAVSITISAPDNFVLE